MLKTFFLAVIFSGTFAGTLQGLGAELEYPAFPLKDAPMMDGKWDGNAWADIPAAVGLARYKAEAFVQTRQTTFKMGWHGNNLYVLVRCEEPEPDKIKVDENNYRDGWYPDDNIEFFFSADNSSNKGVKQFVTNSRGARWCNFAAPSNSEPWAAVAAKGVDNWSVEIKIPFALLGIDDDFKAKRFWFNLARAANNNPENDKLSCFAPVKSGFGQAANFAALVFKDAPAPEQLAQVRKDLNRLDKWLRERLWRIANVKEAFLADKQGDENLAAFMELKQKAKKLLAEKDVSGAFALLNQYDLLASEFSIPVKKMVFEVEARQTKDLKVWLNGKAVSPQDGRWPISLREGVNVIAMTAATDGKTAGLRPRIPSQPDLESRWSVGAVADDGWKAAAFDDRSWKKAEMDKEGYLCVPDGVAGDVCFRQIVLWGENHYSGLPCIQPKVREWGFAEKSMENLFHVLYAPPPLTFPLEEYQFILDVPKGFTLLEEKYPDDAKGGKLNRRPQTVIKEEVKHENRPYTRYRFTYDAKFVQPNTTQCTLIPLMLNEYKEADRLCKFYFRRMASGNLTELEQALPVRVLPPLNGRVPKNVMLTQYLSEPWLRFAGEGGGKLFPEHFETHMRQSLDVGFNYWVIGPTGDAYTKKVYDRVLEHGGSIILWGPNNYPLWGSINPAWALGQLLQATPDFRVRFFKEAERVKTTAQICRSFATGAGAAQFKEAVKKDIGQLLNGSPELKLVGFPKATIYWNDWECQPWGSPDVKDYRCFCFCDNCKNAFRQHAKLPDTADLSDDNIHKNLKSDWSLFRNELDGRMNGIVREACNELGLKYLYYDQVAFKNNWPPLKGKIDGAFPGWPGDGQAIGYGPHDGVGSFAVDQQSLDDEMAFLRETLGLPRIHGQLFASAFNYASVKPWTNWSQTAISGRDGFNNVKRIKSQILRVVAAFHGGVDLDSSLERCAGQQYYIGEATRIISTYEELFWSGERTDNLAVSAQIKYPNLLVLTKDGERLVLLFNEGDKPLEVELGNKGLKAGQTATVWEKPDKTDNPERMKVTVPAEDVALVHIK